MLALEHLQPLGIAFDHLGSDVEQAFVMGDDADAVWTDEPFSADRRGVDGEEVGQHRPGFGRQSLDGVAIGSEPRNVAVLRPPHTGVGIIFRSDGP